MIVNYDFDIEYSKDGLKILKVYKEDKKIYIGSKYRMKEKIDEQLQVDGIIESGSIVILFGIGSGEYVKRLYERNKNIKIIIFEPNLKLIKYIKSNLNEYEILTKQNIVLLEGEKTEDIYIYLKSIIGEFNVNKIIYRSILNYEKVYDMQILEFNRVVKNVMNDLVISRNTNMLFHRTWFDALISNLRYMIKSMPINLLQNKYKGIPAIIVSAGPSLNKNIDALKTIGDNILIFSGGRTLKPLIEKNIQPSLIGIVDPGEASYKLVKGYIEKTKVPLLFYEGTNEEVVKQHTADKIIFTQNYMIKDIFNMDIENMGVGGSIAHTLTATAAFLGCNPIIFIGQDLAYTGEKYHADIAINQFISIEENKVSSEIDTIDEIYVEDVDGNKVRTSKVLDNFRRELEKIIKQNKDITFINATEGGAKINGTIQMTLKNAIEKYKVDNDINFLLNLEKVDEDKVRNRAIETLENVIISDKKIIDQSRKALDIINELKMYLSTNGRSKINQCLKKLDIIDEVIKENYEKLHILRNIIYPIMYNILSANKCKSEKEIIKQNKYLYESILETSEQVLEPIESLKKDIENIGVLYD